MSVITSPLHTSTTTPAKEHVIYHHPGEGPRDPRATPTRDHVIQDFPDQGLRDPPTTTAQDHVIQVYLSQGPRGPPPAQPRTMSSKTTPHKEHVIQHHSEQQSCQPGCARQGPRYPAQPPPRHLEQSYVCRGSEVEDRSTT